MTIAACGDDANDGAHRAEVEVVRPATISSTSPAPTPSTAPVDAPTTSGPATRESVAESTVEPTGVVVPVIALDNIFRPELIVVSVGDEVLWENRGQNDHNALYVDGDDWGVEVESFGPGATYSHVFTEPGEYAYYCSIHGTTTFGMIGTVVVEG